MRCARAGWLAMMLPLAGCLGEGTGEGGFGLLGASTGAQPEPVLRRTELYRGRVIVAGPRGYCIDRESLRRGAGGAFVLIASCESLTGTPQGAVEPAVLTVSVLPRGTDDAQPDAEALAALARGARILQSGQEDGLSYVQLSTGGDSLLPGGDPRHWRGSMLVDGHLVGIAVYGPEGGPAAGALGRNLLRAQAEAIRSLSPAGQ